MASVPTIQNVVRLYAYAAVRDAQPHVRVSHVVVGHDQTGSLLLIGSVQNASVGVGFDSRPDFPQFAFQDFREQRKPRYPAVLRAMHDEHNELSVLVVVLAMPHVWSERDGV